MFSNIISKSKQAQRCYSLFPYSPEIILSDENRRKTVENFARIKQVKKQTATPTKNAAVLIPLCVINNRVSLLYTLRAPNLKTHRGQVSFPGGMQDIGEDFQDTALRETEEELGLKREHVLIWGEGNVIVSKDATGISPIIGQITCKNVMKEIKMNPNEVCEVFTVPLDVLCDLQRVKHTQFRTNYSLPVYTGGRRKIWGLTAMMTHLFLHALLPKKLYNFNLKCISSVKGPSVYGRN